ncbi:MAG: class II fructose-bisphosphate aldolase [Deltaproteobacteria bacterium]|nr:class II fructose-bisphosphate aldolase [Deltaproteobacteria bacterium]
MDVKKYDEALQYRPENVKKLFPDSKTLIVSGKVIHAAQEKRRASGKPALTIAANGRNDWVIEGALRAASRTGAVLLVEIAKSEGNYCEPNFYNLAKKVNDIAMKAELRVIVAIHADHYAVKNEEDLAQARDELPKMVEAGMTSVAIDASHLPPHTNVMANIELCKLLPDYISIETEVGEIKGEQGLSTPDEAAFHIKALNAHGVFPTWIAVNNGSSHGLEATGGGIDVDLTKAIHEAIAPYHVWGAQHGTSGNNYDKLRDIVARTRTTKANVATALQMVGWGLEVNEFGNAALDADGNFNKLAGKGLTAEAWQGLVDYANDKGFKGGAYKKLNKPMDELLKKQPAEVQARMVKAVEEFVVNLIENVFGAAGTVDEALDIILEAKSGTIPTAHEVIEDKAKWTEAYIAEQGAKLDALQAQIEGDFDD